MSTDLVATDFTQSQMALITSTVAKGASPDELKLFLYRAKNMGLDPLKPGQIHFVKYGNGPGSIVVGIEGFRSIAHRTGKLAGIKRGPIKDDSGQLIGAWAEVYRVDWQHPAREEVPLSEYNAGTPVWRKMPETMIKKVAECAALRMAFPNDLGGVYAPEEMDQATSPAQSLSIKPEQPMANDGYTDTAWRFKFGKFKGRTVEEIYNDPAQGPKVLKSYVDWLVDDAYKKGQSISPNAKEVIDNVEAFLGSMEQSIAKAESPAQVILKNITADTNQDEFANY